MNRVLFPMLLFVASAAHAAEPIVVQPFAGSTVDPELTESATELLIVFLRDAGYDARRPTLEDPAGAARAIGAKEVVVGRMTRIGRKALVFVEVRDLSGAVTWSGRLSAERPEDLESVLKRMARGIEIREHIDETGGIYTVTESEAKNLARKKANHYFGVQLGGYVPMGSGDNELSSGFGLFWLYDLRNLMLEVEIHSFFVGDNGGRAGLGLAGYYPFSEDDFTPFIGGGLELGGVSRGNYECNDTTDPAAACRAGDNGGLGGFLGAGVLMGRTSTVSLRADLRYLVGFYDVAGETPHGAMFAVGIGF